MLVRTQAVVRPVLSACCVMHQILGLFHPACWCLWDYVPICPYTRLQRHTHGECVYPGDQAENLMIRASRGSGIAGLASISQASWSFLGTCLSQATSQLHTWPLISNFAALAPLLLQQSASREGALQEALGRCICLLLHHDKPLYWQQTLIAALHTAFDRYFIPELCTQILIIPCY